MSPVGNAQSQRLAIPQVPGPTLHDIEFARASQRVYQLFHNPPAASQGRQSRLRVKLGHSAMSAPVSALPESGLGWTIYEYTP